MKGIIAGGSQHTVEAGAHIFRRGGNAVDAAVAAAFAGFMGDGILSTPSGGGFALLHGPDRPPLLYDFFCSTPGLGTDRRDRPDLDFAPITVQYESGTSVYHLGRGSSAVPGVVAGLARLLDDAGSLPLDVVIEPAIRLAHEGVIVDLFQAYLIQLVDIILHFDASCLPTYAPRGSLLVTGERLANPALAATLERIARDGWQTLYTGAVADAILADQAQHGGLITAEDLATYQVQTRAPLRFEYRDHTVYTNPPPSAGGILIAYALSLLERADLGRMAHGDAQHAALLAEIMRQTTIARHRDDPAQMPDAAAWHAWLTGPHLDADWAAVRAALAANGLRGDPGERPTTPSTTHISAIDERGLSVGLTSTPGETAGYMVAGTGILMNNILGEEELSPQGFHQWEPGQRLASMMAPTIVADPSGLSLVIGSGGAARLRTAIFHLLSNALDWGMPLDAAVLAPRVHFEDNRLHLEGGFDPATAAALDNRGYTITRWDDRAFYFGGTHVARRDAGGALSAMGDPRRGGAVAVVA